MSYLTAKIFKGFDSGLLTGVILIAFKKHSVLEIIIYQIQFWNIIDKGLTRESSHNLTVLTDISSKPWALLMSRCLIIKNI